MLDMVCDYLDVWSISKLEECCHLLRGLVVENKLYRRRVKRIVCLRTPGDWIQEDGTVGINNHVLLLNSACRQPHEVISCQHKTKLIQ